MNHLPALINKYKFIWYCLHSFNHITVTHETAGYERKVRTVPLTRPLQIGHFRSDGAHSLHTTRCPHGMKTMLTSLSIHTLQVRSSCRRRSCSSMGRSDRSWLGDAASFDWAMRSLSRCTSFFWIQLRKTSAAAFPLVRTSSISLAVCCWADVWALRPL